jgi:hypothetical protein
MTATSIGITASVFGELKFLKTREGQTVIGAAVLDDILGIVILAVVVALAGGQSFSIGPILKLMAAAVVFVAVALFLSRTAAPCFRLDPGSPQGPWRGGGGRFRGVGSVLFRLQGDWSGGGSGGLRRRVDPQQLQAHRSDSGNGQTPGGTVRHHLLRVDRHGHGPLRAQSLRPQQP